VYIEVKDPRVEEFFKRILKEGQPADDVIRTLLENPCAAKRLVTMRKYEERLASAFEGLIANIAMYVEYLVAKRVATAIGAAQKIVNVRQGDNNAHDNQCDGDPDSRRGCVEEVMNGAGGCLKFSEIEKIYGRRLNSEILKRWGLVRREKGVWCLPQKQAKKRVAETV